MCILDQTRQGSADSPPPPREVSCAPTLLPPLQLYPPYLGVITPLVSLFDLMSITWSGSRVYERDR